MEEMINAPPKVHWSKLQGNKYSKSLHPAMLLDTGCHATAKARLVGNSKYGSNYVVIVYDRLYVVHWLRIKVIKPLINLGITGIVKLVREAWKASKQSNPIQLELDAKINGKIQI